MPYKRPRRSPLALWHLLSLDAPTVATVWTIFIARCAGLALPRTAPTAMFLAVWMLYAADRLLDARPQPDGSAPPELEERHRFHQRHRSGFLLAIALSSLTLASLLHRLDPRALHLYAVLATLLASWLLLVHARPLPAAEGHRLPKEFAVGIFFAAAVFIPTVAREPSLRLALLPSAILFAAACTLNCLFLYAWEHPGKRPLAHRTTRWATRHLPTLTTALIAQASFVCLINFRPFHAVAPALACVLSAVLFLLLNARRSYIALVHLRAAADAVLLTPLLLLPFLR